MKTFFSIIVFSLTSGLVHAASGGVEIPWSEHTGLVRNNCTGTVLSARFVMTAQHCQTNPVNLYSGVVQVKNRIDHPDYPIRFMDVSLFDLGPVATQHVNFLSNQPVQTGELVSGFGFGGAGSKLSMITHEVVQNSYIDSSLDTKIVKGRSVEGDSGMPWIDKNGMVVAVHRGQSSFADGSSATRLSYFADWLTSQVDGWHFASRAETPGAGTLTIELQSLHKDVVADQSYATGDVVITGGTCRGAQVKPFEICTLQISSSGGFEGVVHLSGKDNERIIINEGKKKVTPETPTADKGDSKSGGSLGFGFVAALGLCFLRIRR